MGKSLEFQGVPARRKLSDKHDQEKRVLIWYIIADCPTNNTNMFEFLKNIGISIASVSLFCGIANKKDPRAPRSEMRSTKKVLSHFLN